MEKKIIKIDYDKVVNDYNSQLVTKLRDFGDNLLDLWVPDEDIIQSLLGIVFSITQNNQQNIQLKVKRAALEKNHDKFREIFEKFSEVSIYETKQDYQIEILVNNLNQLNEINDSYFAEKTNQPTKNIDLYNKKLKSNSKSLNINEIYGFPDKVLKDKNLFFIKKSQLKYYLSDTNYIHSYIKKINFFIKMSDEKIISVKFNCDKSMVKILTNFSKIILNTPLLEAFEHGTMKLENSFRKKIIKKKINGIITPLVIKNFFSNLQNIMIDIYTKYLKINNLDAKKNLFDPGLSESWRKKTDNEKKQSINKIINSYSKNLDIKFKFNQIEDEVKVLIDIIEKKDIGPRKYVLLLALEKLIRRKLDRRLEIFYKDEPDSNKLRQKNL